MISYVEPNITHDKPICIVLSYRGRGEYILLCVLQRREQYTLEWNPVYRECCS